MALRRCIFISFQQVTFELVDFTNFKALFSVVSTDFPELMSKVEKTVKRSIQPYLDRLLKLNISQAFFMVAIEILLCLRSKRDSSAFKDHYNNDS